MTSITFPRARELLTRDSDKLQPGSWYYAVSFTGVYRWSLHLAPPFKKFWEIILWKTDKFLIVTHC